MAEYPKKSIAEAHQGLAVAELEIGPDGNSRHVSILQAPDDAIGRSVQACASRWRMKPVAAGSQETRTGKLYFYFVISPEGGKVYLANDPADKKALVSLWR